ncbi:hypothetical protein L0P75_16135, partial [Faecalibacillus intestinalis]|uniref:hypothetical protein n=1 Tax=Faecalibacillus intestinalis TaxID=1982626 RepID=UPI00296917D8|nr:hypothetical protein [Faecalibacillus intestinalis]
HNKITNFTKKGASFYYLLNKNINFYMDKYTNKKKKNQEIIKYIAKHLSEDNLNLIYNCGSYLEMITDQSIETKKLHKA